MIAKGAYVVRRTDNHDVAHQIGDLLELLERVGKFGVQSPQCAQTSKLPTTSQGENRTSHDVSVSVDPTQKDNGASMGTHTPHTTYTPHTHTKHTPHTHTHHKHTPHTTHTLLLKDATSYTPHILLLCSDTAHGDTQRHTHTYVRDTHTHTYVRDTDTHTHTHTYVRDFVFDDDVIEQRVHQAGQAGLGDLEVLRCVVHVFGEQHRQQQREEVLIHEQLTRQTLTEQRT